MLQLTLVICIFSLTETDTFNLFCSFQLHFIIVAHFYSRKEKKTKEQQGKILFPYLWTLWPQQEEILNQTNSPFISRTKHQTHEYGGVRMGLSGVWVSEVSEGMRDVVGAVKAIIEHEVK